MKNIATGIMFYESGSDANGFTANDLNDGYLLFKGVQIAENPISWVLVLCGIGLTYYLIKSNS